MEKIVDKILFEGILNEAVIADLLKRVALWEDGVYRNTTNIKLTIIELCGNIITHHSGTAYSEVVIEPLEGSCRLTFSSYASVKDLEIITTSLEELRKTPGLKEHYFAKLGNIQSGRSVNLGLLRVFRMCNGNISLDSRVVASKIMLTFKLTIDDHH